MATTAAADGASKDEVREAFVAFDTDGSGTIDASELASALNQLHIPTDNEQAKKVLDRFDTNGNGVLELAEFRKLAEEMRSSHDVTMRQLEAEQWTAAKWLDATGITKPLATSLLGHAIVRGNGNNDLAEMRKLGSVTDDHKLRETLVERVFAGIDSIVDLLMPQLRELSSSEAATGADLHEKFASAENFTLRYGGLSTFFGGLEAKIGPPDPQVYKAMVAEHCERDDSREPFMTTNYGMTTTSETEWKFVAAPEKAPSKGWPIETRGVHGEAKPRQSVPLDQVATRLCGRNAELEALGEPPLTLQEVLGGRLYTGPLFVKYNAILRGFGVALSSCKGNPYTSSLHAINSCIVKTGKLSQAAKVYRGISGGMLPAEFWTPNSHGVRGGIESAFMSTTLNRQVALEYASNGGAGRAGIVFEIQQGMVDRGADMAWISQYPHEKEILFAPLTGLEVHSTRVEGGVLVVVVRLSVNLASATIEQVVSKRRKVVKDMCEQISLRILHAVRSREAWEELRLGLTPPPKMRRRPSAFPVTASGGASSATPPGTVKRGGIAGVGISRRGSINRMGSAKERDIGGTLTPRADGAVAGTPRRDSTPRTAAASSSSPLPLRAGTASADGASQGTPQGTPCRDGTPRKDSTPRAVLGDGGEADPPATALATPPPGGVEAVVETFLDSKLGALTSREPEYYNENGPLGDAIQEAVALASILDGWPRGLLHLAERQGVPCRDGPTSLLRSAEATFTPAGESPLRLMEAYGLVALFWARAALSALDLSKRKLAPEVVSALTRGLPARLSWLSLEACDIAKRGNDLAGLQCLCQFASLPDSGLLTLRLASNALLPTACAPLSHALQHSPSLTAVDLSHNSLCGKAHGIGKYEPSGIEAVARALTTNRTLTALNMLGNELDTEAAKMLATIAKARGISLCGISPTQTHANFYYMGLKAPDAQLLAADLKLRPSLTILELPSNEIGPEGASALAASIRDHAGLTAIDLSFNQLAGVNHSTGKGTYTPAGVRAIAEAVRTSTVSAVTSLNLKYNDLKPTDIELLREAVAERSGSFVRRSKAVLGQKATRRSEVVLDL